jgi:hypothetical protein
MLSFSSKPSCHHPSRYLQNSSVSELPTYQLRSLRVTPYEHKRIIFGKHPGLRITNNAVYSDPVHAVIRQFFF